MGIFDKVKNLFTEEIEEEIEVEDEPIKKEMIQVEIPSPAKRRSTKETEEIEETPKKEEPKEEEYKFPFFDDSDFSTLEKKEKKEEKKEKKKQLYRGEYRSEPKEVYSPQKEEKKIFKPTPIISPVYGILDKNYQKEDIKAKNSKPRSYYNPKEATVDEIRNKAYGTLEDDIETTLFGRDEETVQDEITENTNRIEFDKLPEEKPRHGQETSKDDELTDLLEAELTKEDKKNEGPRKISDSELFSMIDSMYQKGDKQ